LDRGFDTLEILDDVTVERLFFRKSQRITSEADFGRVLSYKCFSCKGMFRLYAAPNELEILRFGVSVSTSCGGAVVRNRLKRLGREVFRQHQHEIPAGFDYILIFTTKKPKIKALSQKQAKSDLVELTYHTVESSFLAMLAQISKKITS